MRIEPRTLTPTDLARIDASSREDLNKLPFGTVLLGPDGTILEYNLAQSRLTRVERWQAIGRNGFSDGAPGLDFAALRAAFQNVLEARSESADLVHEWTLEHATVRVHVSVHASEHRSGCWLLMTLADETGAARAA